MKFMAGEYDVAIIGAGHAVKPAVLRHSRNPDVLSAGACPLSAAP